MAHGLAHEEAGLMERAMNTDQRLRSVMEAVLGIDSSAVRDADSPMTIPQWDSVTHLQLMMALEAEFDIEFSPEEMASLSTVGLIRRRLDDGQA
jgi:acyl carrier protein